MTKMTKMTLMDKIMDLIKGRCPYWRECEHYRVSSTYCNDSDHVYCGIFKHGGPRSKGWL